MRTISKTLALMSLLAPLGANALGIGDIRLHSALNQALNAEIPLVTSEGDEISDIRVTLASQEAFAKAGLERHYSLSKLRFRPEQKADGSYVIKVSSGDTIREPFLSFMIEVHWPQGRLQREFTVLLDPPASFQEAEGEEPELAETEIVQRPVARPLPRPQPVEPIVERPRPRREVSAAPPPEPVEPVAVTGTQYGPVSRNETLWSIAQQQNQDASISQGKMMAAIHKANPQAFTRNNINALKAGETITIPDRETVMRLTGAIATPPMPRTGRLNTKAAAKPVETTTALDESGTEGQLKLLAPTPGKSKDETVGSGGRGKGGKSREDIALEVADSIKQENEEIRKSLVELKEQLSGIQKLLVLKDAQIATLQAQKQPAAQPALPPPSVEPAKPPTATEPAKQAPPPPVPPSPPQVEQAKPPVITPPKPPEAVPATQPAPPTPVVKRPPPPKPVRPALAKDEGIMAELMEHPSLYLVGGISGLLAVSLWLVKRRRAAMIDDTESILTLSDKEKTLQLKKQPLLQPESASGISEQSTSTARSSFLSEFTPSDFDALGGEMEEVDPISEADVYLAYGRYKQAEELIRSAIAQNPERDECKLKLFEIHYATENAQAFEQFAQELEPTYRETKPDFWEKVAEMGQELCPSNPLFGDFAAAPLEEEIPRNKAPTAQAEASQAKGKEEISAFREEPEESYDYLSTSANDNRQHDRIELEGKTDDAEADAEGIAYDFFSTGAAAPHETDKKEEDDTGFFQADNVIAFEKPKAAPVEEAETMEDLQDKTLDDILAELGVLSESVAASEAVPDTQEKLGETDDRLSLEFEQMLQSEQAVEDTADYMALTDMDEQETKLDLAKAYFDMGDGESARAILEDVAEHGSEAQKQEAWTLLNRLSRKEANRR